MVVILPLVPSRIGQKMRQRDCWLMEDESDWSACWFKNKLKSDELAGERG